MPLRAITGERPGKWKSQLMDQDRRWRNERTLRRSGRCVRSIWMSRCAVRAVMMKPASTSTRQITIRMKKVDVSGPRDQEELDQHDNEQDHREDMIHQAPDAHAGRLDDFDTHSRMGSPG